ncbi:SDR family oxidoreductase [Actinoplanes sp. NPDC020271]|uniref:SDR family oxidoreductase n=1 Tax=Actinoplanes sp. NPDC020271 TaxID=3363896 RepID=UPI0037AABA9C
MPSPPLHRHRQHCGIAGGSRPVAVHLERIPAGRWGRSDDIAGATVFLSSAASDYVSGVVLPVDGGWLGR